MYFVDILVFVESFELKTYNLDYLYVYISRKLFVIEQVLQVANLWHIDQMFIPSLATCFMRYTAKERLGFTQGGFTFRSSHNFSQEWMGGPYLGIDIWSRKAFRGKKNFLFKTFNETSSRLPYSFSSFTLPCFSS